MATSPWNRRSCPRAWTRTRFHHERTGIIFGAGGPSTSAIVAAADVTREKTSPKRIGPFAVPKAMSSGPSAVLATWFEIRGINYSISSACATSVHCIGAAAEQIMLGKQDVMFAGWHRGTRLDAQRHVRRHGRHVVEL